MSMLLLKFLAVGLTALAIGVMYRVPKPALPYACVAAIGGYLVWLSMSYLQTSDITGAFLASVAVTLMAQWFARKKRYPDVIFLIPAMIPLVPGKSAYLAMENLAQGHTADGVSYAVLTLFIGAALAMGLFIVTTLVRFFSKWM